MVVRLNITTLKTKDSYIYEMYYELQIRIIPILIKHGHKLEEAEILAVKILNEYRNVAKEKAELII